MWVKMIFPLSFKRFFLILFHNHRFLSINPLNKAFSIIVLKPLHILLSRVEVGILHYSSNQGAEFRSRYIRPHPLKMCKSNLIIGVVRTLVTRHMVAPLKIGHPMLQCYTPCFCFNRINFVQTGHFLIFSKHSSCAVKQALFLSCL